MIRVANLHIVVGLDICRCYGARPLGNQTQLGFILACHRQGNAFQVEENLNHVLLGTLNRGVLVQYAVDLDFGDCTTGH